MKIAICSDQRGYKLKKEIIKRLSEIEIHSEDYGCFNEERTDFPVFAFKVGEAVVNSRVDFGVAICGSGVGMSISVNKVKGIRCAVARNADEVELYRQHNNINVLALGADNTKIDDAIKMIEKMISTTFLYDRYQKRIDMIEEYENQR